MIEKIPSSLEQLADNNSKILKKYNIIRDSIISSFAKTQISGDFYLKSEFKANNIDTSPDGKFQRLGLSEVQQEKREVLSDILDFDPAMIVVRPEMFHLKNEICDFLVANDFRVNFITDKQITIKEYFQLYKEVIKNVPALQSALPSRTMTYTNALSSIIIFSDPQDRFTRMDQTLADGFFNSFKGTEGKPTKNTIRGDLVFNEALRLGFNNMSNPTISQAVDPFGAYAQIIEQPGEHWYHLKTEEKLYALMYNGQGIHFPNSAELPRDIATLHSCETLLEILESLSK